MHCRRLAVEFVRGEGEKGVEPGGLCGGSPRTGRCSPAAAYASPETRAARPIRPVTTAIRAPRYTPYPLRYTAHEVGHAGWGGVRGSGQRAPPPLSSPHRPARVQERRSHPSPLTPYPWTRALKG
eukprot:2019057-Rhodomonas_salina.1